MKLLGIAAAAVTFWMLVLCAQLVVRGARQEPPERAAAPRVDPAPELPPPTVIPESGPMPKSAIVVGMNAVKPLIARCHEAYGVSGMALVNVVIAPSGRVSSATTTGRFAATPVGACVEQAVLTAQFPPSDGLVTPYPFQLR